MTPTFLMLAAVLSSDAPPPEAALDAPLSASARIWVPTLHTVGLMAGMRVALSVAYPRSFDPTLPGDGGHVFVNSFTAPPQFSTDLPFLQSDGDSWTTNVVGHGLFGSEVYQRFRHCGHGPLVSFASTAIASTVWEYGIEGFHKQPSAIDLTLTPTLGSLLGEGRYQLYRALSPAKGAKRILLFVVDPFGETERALGTKC